jgi:hypothetical protein
VPVTCSHVELGRAGGRERGAGRFSSCPRSAAAEKSAAVAVRALDAPASPAHDVGTPAARVRVQPGQDTRLQLAAAWQAGHLTARAEAFAAAPASEQVPVLVAHAAHSAARLDQRRCLAGDLTVTRGRWNGRPTAALCSGRPAAALLSSLPAGSGDPPAASSGSRRALPGGLDGLPGTHRSAQCE